MKKEIYRKLTLDEVKKLDSDDTVRIVLPSDHDRYLTALVHPMAIPNVLHVVHAATVGGTDAVFKYDQYDNTWYAEQKVDPVVFCPEGYFTVKAGTNGITVNCTLTPDASKPGREKPLTFPVVWAGYDSLVEAIFGHTYNGDPENPTYVEVISD